MVKVLNKSADIKRTPALVYSLNQKTQNYDLISKLDLISDYYTSEEILLSDDGKFLVALEDIGALPLDLDECRYSVPVADKTNVVISIYEPAKKEILKQFVFSDLFTQDDLDAMSSGPRSNYLLYWRGTDGFYFRGSDTNTIFVSGPVVTPRHPGFEINLHDLSISRLQPHWAEDEEKPEAHKSHLRYFIYGSASGIFFSLLVALFVKRKKTSNQGMDLTGKTPVE